MQPQEYCAPEVVFIASYCLMLGQKELSCDEEEQHSLFLLLLTFFLLCSGF